MVWKVKISHLGAPLIDLISGMLKVGVDRTLIGLCSCRCPVASSHSTVRVLRLANSPQQERLCDMVPGMPAMIHEGIGLDYSRLLYDTKPFDSIQDPLMLPLGQYTRSSYRVVRHSHVQDSFI